VLEFDFSAFEWPINATNGHCRRFPIQPLLCSGNRAFNERGSFALAAPGSMNFAFGGWVEFVYPGIFKGLDQQ
jgi:hypothetical protein